MAGKSRKRRAKGDGSLWELKSGSWRAEVPLGPGKKPLRKVFRGPTAHQDARAWKTQTAAARDAGGLALTPAAATVGDRITAWLASRAGEVEAGTLESYRDDLERLVRPTAGPIRLADFTPARARDWADALARPQVVGGVVKVRSANARKRAVMMLRAVLEADVGTLLPSNPLARVRTPSPAKPPVLAYTLPEATRLLAAADATRWHALVRLLLDGGLRPGEAYALRVTDFDPAGRTVRVTKSLSCVRGRLIEKPPKTAAGSRTVAVSGPTAAALAAHLDALAPRQRGGLGLVFPSRSGGWVRHNNLIRRLWHPLRTAAGVPDYGLRNLRHTSATLLLAAGAPIKAVSMRLGHSKIETTLAFYAAYLPTDQARVVEVAGVLFPHVAPHGGGTGGISPTT